MNKKYYVEFYTKETADTTQPYILQSKWFNSREKAKQWLKDNFVYIDSNDLLFVDLMRIDYHSSEDYDIVFEEHLW